MCTAEVEREEGGTAAVATTSAATGLFTAAFLTELFFEAAFWGVGGFEGFFSFAICVFNLLTIRFGNVPY